MYILLLIHFIDGETEREIQEKLYKAISSASTEIKENNAQK